MIFNPNNSKSSIKTRTDLQDITKNSILESTFSMREKILPRISSTDVHTVVINGPLVMLNKKILNSDVQATMVEVRRLTDKISGVIPSQK
jgi:hypothetical protein